MEAVWKQVLGSVGETILGFASDGAGLKQVGEVAVEGNLSEADHNADARQGFDFGGEVRSAVAEFLREGLVAGWGAADDGGDPGVTELEAIVAGDSQRPSCEAELVGELDT